MRRKRRSKLLKKLREEVDFNSERYFSLRYRLGERGSPPQLVTAGDFQSFSLLMYQTELNRLRIELYRIQRNVENLRLPSLEVVGLTQVADEMKSLKSYLDKLAETVKKLTDLQPIVANLRGLLDVADSCDRVIRFAEGGNVPPTILVGIKGIQAQLLSALERFGIVGIEVKPGDKFDPARHQAVGTIKDDGKTEGEIAEVHLAGYLFQGKPFRPAQVVVVKNS